MANSNGAIPEFVRSVQQPKKRAFLIAYAETFNLCEAARRLGIDRTMHYYWLKKDPLYAAAYEVASQIGAASLEAELTRRAYTGNRRYKFHQGKPIMVPCPKEHPDAVNVGTARRPRWQRHYYEVEFSDTLGIFLMKGAMPEKYRERHEFKGPDSDIADAIERELSILASRQTAADAGPAAGQDTGNGSASKGS